MAVNNATTPDSDSFFNSAFFDLAPLLTLFGDAVTKQFLGTSMGMADTLLLRIAPIGIMTIVVSAIRVGGNNFMKSLTGRARDSPDEDEKEILSSTSTNTREIWDGYRVVRQTGPSKTVALVFEPNLVNHSSHGERGFGGAPDCLKHLQMPMAESHPLWVEDSGVRLLPGWKLGSHYVRNGDLSVLLPVEVPPNLTLNGTATLHKQRKMTTVLLTAGILVQVVVMAINAMVVYWWKWLRSEKFVLSYGYPLWASGTVAITLGTCICGWIVESSSRKYRRLSSLSTSQARVQTR